MGVCIRSGYYKCFMLSCHYKLIVSLPFGAARVEPEIQGVMNTFATMKGRLKVVSAPIQAPNVGKKPSEEGKSKSCGPAATTCREPFVRSMRITRSFSGSAA